MAETTGNLILLHIKQLVTVCSKNEPLKRGTEQGSITIIEDGVVLSTHGKIRFVGSYADFSANHDLNQLKDTHVSEIPVSCSW